MTLTAFLLPLAVLAPTPTLEELRVKGPNLVTAKGRVVRLEGLNIPSLEWSNEGDQKIHESLRVAIEDWRSNAIRLPMAQDRWFGKAEYQNDGGEAYRKLIDRMVADTNRRGAWIILDLHWSNAGEWGKNIAQHWMPDEHSATFWKDVAKRYANRPGVLFDLYNEPHDVSWTIWRNGGDVDEEWNGKRLRYRSPGMQGLLDAVRSVGARNVCFASGLDWGYDLTGVLNGYALSDPKGNGVGYASHIYPWKSEWDAKVGAVAKLRPVLIGEVGCEPDPKQEDPMTWAPKVLAWMEKNRVHVTGWCFHPDASPRMLKNWDYEPTPYWGEFFKRYLARRR